ncbi:MAG: LPS export ABC transporter periplasmic protein LptC [Leptospiraceae bacterium]|nr:LPS export ABC transporter periplasmic protein LptC [Leptospiraceae bacterium]
MKFNQSRFTLTALMWVSLLLSSCSVDTFEQVAPAKFSDPEAGIEIENFSAVSFDGQKTAWNLKAQYANLLEKKQQTKVHMVHLLYYGDQSEPTDITADEGILFEADKNLFLRGNVIVKSPNGRILYTEELKWSDARNELRSDTRVKIIMSSGDILEGNGLLADRNLTRIELVGGSGFHPSEK